MIEIIRLNEQLVRVTGFRQVGSPEHPVFDVVIQIPGEAANRDFTPLLAAPRLTLTILHPDRREERHDVVITEHHLHTAGPEQRPLFRHQLRLEPVSVLPDDPLGPIGEELAELLARFDRLLQRLDRSGIVSRQAVEERSRTLLAADPPTQPGKS